MEWKMGVNDLLPDTINKLNSTLVPPGYTGDVRTLRAIQEVLTKLIDAIGEQSATAQGLSRVITTADKLRRSPSHSLYLLKDAKANGGEGEVIGMLKVGRKHLYLFDARDQVREVEPLCVLDFFVVGDRQRHGFGRMLFDFMLQDLETSPHEMPIDGPSANMERFLSKNYGLDEMVRQNNNFAVSPLFFADNTTEQRGAARGPAGPAAGHGRFAAHKPPSVIGNVIHGGVSYYQEVGSGLAWIDRHATGALEAELGAFGAVMAPDSEGEAEVEAEDDEAAERGRKDEASGVTGGVQPRAEAERELEPQPATELAPSPSRPRSLPVPSAPPAPLAPSAPLAPLAPSPAGSVAERQDAQLTDRGYFDVKFYHNKLW